jgi:cytochrome P450
MINIFLAINHHENFRPPSIHRDELVLGSLRVRLTGRSEVDEGAVVGTETEQIDVRATKIAHCPVVRADFSATLEAGSYWRMANEYRQMNPALFNSMAQGYWIFTDHEHVRDMYRTPEVFSSESITPWEPDPVYRFVPTQIDAPDHITYRQILNPWFSPGSVDRVEPTAREICRRLVAETAASGSCDFVSSFALRYPTEVFLTMIGCPASDADRFVPWVEDFFSGFGGDASGVEPMVAALNGIRDYWISALAERRGEHEPREGDLASHLIRAKFGDRSLTDDEILDMLTVLVLAGLDTTRAQLGYLFRYLADHPDDRHRLIDEPELVPSAVEESLRLFTIIFGDGRKVAQDTDFHGCPLKRGDMVYGLVSAANRDPKVYDRPDEFVIDRKPNVHFGFAGGPHRCLGAHLARREMQIALEEWLRVIPDFRVVNDAPLMERGGGAMMTLKKLPLAWDVGS